MLQKFQYNYCFGGTFKEDLINYYGEEFQYNYCFGGTLGISLSINGRAISIQLLFRWYVALNPVFSYNLP